VVGRVGEDAYVSEHSTFLVDGADRVDGAGCRGHMGGVVPAGRRPGWSDLGEHGGGWVKRGNLDRQWTPTVGETSTTGSNGLSTLRTCSIPARPDASDLSF
jgi:hypothetical protein